MKALAALSLAIWAAAASAQPPQPLAFDQRVETLEWRENADLPLRTTIGGSLTVIFAPGEAVQSVLVGDPGAVEVRVAPQADSLVLHTQRQPANDLIEVRTQLRRYRFHLAVGPANDVAYAVRFSIGPAGDSPLAETLPPLAATNLYGFKGELNLRPVQVSDDGARTYIEWGADQALPAVFAINALGEEETVDSYMRSGIMVIDRVFPRLIFRIGKHSAQASRLGTSGGGKR